MSTYHSRRPQLIGWKIDLVRLTWPRSTANTPIWQVTLDSSSTVVFDRAERDVQVSAWPGQPWPLSTDLMVKYIANSAAKNISSEDSQMMVPTLTRLGLLAGVRGVVSTVAVATKQLLRQPVGDRYATPRVGTVSVPCSVMKVVVYSHDADVRAQVRLAIGRRPAMDVPDAEIIEVATRACAVPAARRRRRRRDGA